VTVLSNRGKAQRGAVTVIKAWDEDDAAYPLKLFKQVALNGCDVIHIQHEYWLYGRGIHSMAFLLLMLLLKFLRKPVIITMHCIIPRSELTGAFFKKHRLGIRHARLKRGCFIFYNVLIGIMASKIIVHSNMARQVLVNDYGIKSDKVIVIPHGSESFNAELDRRVEDEDEKVILCFGEIRRGKGIEYAIDAMPKVLERNTSCRLLVAGMYDTKISPESAGYLEELMARVEHLKLRDQVEFRTNITDEEVSLYFSKASIVIFPYVEDEIIAASGPLLTAMSFGKPIVATRLRRFTGYLVNGENSLIVEPANPTGLADAIISILRNDELRGKLSASALKYAREISWRIIAKRTLSVYEALVKG
jgi:glycosyltransferase involved in cell wall biosynthesis